MPIRWTLEPDEKLSNLQKKVRFGLQACVPRAPVVPPHKV